MIDFLTHVAASFTGVMMVIALMLLVAFLSRGEE